MAERSPTSPRPLTLTYATALVVASMVGTGVFTTGGLVLAELRSPLAALGVWLGAGVLSLAGATVYAELGAMMPRAGGEYVYLTRAFHPAFGFLSGWVALLVGFAAPVAAGALAFGGYAQALWPSLPIKATALALVVTTTLLHARDVRWGGRVQAVLTGLVVAVSGAFVAGAVISGRADWTRLVPGAHDLAPAVPLVQGRGADALAVSLMYVGYSYFGWNGAAYVAGEISNPQRTLPRALIGGTALVTLLYVALNAAFLAAVPAPALAGRVEVADLAAGALFGPNGRAFVSTLVLLAIAGSVSALGMTGPRVVQAMGEDGVFFRALGRTNRAGAPTLAVLLQGALAALGVLTAAFEPLLVYAGFTLTLSAAVTVVGAFALRRREPAAARPYRALAWPLSGLAFVAMAVFMSIFATRSRPLESAAAVGTLVLGGLVWMWWRRRRTS